MDAPGSPTRLTTDQFCRQVCAYVRFRPDHAAITAELIAHMEDHQAALLERNPDMLPREAEAEAIRAMGSPEDLGRELNKSHSPLLGWFQIWFGRAVWTVAVLVLAIALLQAGNTLFNLAALPYNNAAYMNHLLEHYDEYDVAADFTPDTSWQWDGYTFSIQRAVITRSEAGESGGEALHLNYLMKVTHANPWQREPEFREWLWAEDDLGNRYPSRGQQEQENLPVSAGDSAGNPAAGYPFVSYYDMWVTGIDPEADQLTLRFTRYGENVIYLTLPLKGGLSNG